MIYKIAFFLILLLSVSISNAQRQVDISCEAVLKPDTVFTYQTTYCSMIAKNNGPDTLYADDTILYRFIMPGNGFGDIYFPATGTYIKKLNKTMLAGDTIFLDYLIPSVIVHKTDFNEFTGIIDLYERKDSLSFIKEDLSQVANNNKVIYIWYMGENVGKEEVNSENIKVYPSLVTDQVSIESLIPVRDISIADINGKIIQNISFVPFLTYTLNLEGVPSGIYFIKTQTANKTSLKKIMKL